MGFGAGPSIDYMVTDQMALGANGSFARNGLNTEERDLLRTVDPTFDLKYTQIGGSAHIKYWFPMNESPMNVYLIGGMGLTHFKVEASASGLSAAAAENKFSGYGGLGLGYDFSDKVALGVQNDINFVTLSGVTAPTFGIKAGMTFGVSGGGGP